MPTFRLVNQAPQYLLANGSVNAGGSLTFYETDLTTLQNTWSDPDKTTLNPNPVVLDAAGRAATDIWLDGSYGVVLKDASGVVIWTRNNVAIPGGTSTSLPAPEADKFVYSPDGVTFVMSAILQVPDPTGLGNYVLTSDGTGVPIWQLPVTPEPPADPDIVVGTTDFRAGLTDETTKFFEQWGTASAPASGSHATSVAVTFPTAFKETPFITATIAQASICAAGLVGGVGISSASASGCTINVNVNDDDTRSEFNIVSPVSLMWHAVGRRDVSP